MRDEGGVGGGGRGLGGEKDGIAFDSVNASVGLLREGGREKVGHINSVLVT